MISILCYLCLILLWIWKPVQWTQAFAWFSDLLVEHAEMFWSMFAFDMERVLAEQPPDTWDSFPLFQILNDYLRTDGKFNRHLVTYSSLSNESLN